MTGVMIPAVQLYSYTACLPRVLLHGTPGKQLRSAHDSAAKADSNGLIRLAASIASCRAASATQIKGGNGQKSHGKTHLDHLHDRQMLAERERELRNGCGPYCCIIFN